MGVDELPDRIHLGFGQIIALGIEVDGGHFEYLFGCRPADTIDICEGDFDALVLR
jgi:hypothetical protein